MLLNDFEAWVPHPCALRKGALFGFQHLGPEPTLSQRRERMGHSPRVIKEDVFLKRSIPYQLLVTTDKSYVVLSQDPNEKSIEVNRDSVAGIVVLQEPHAK